MQEPKPRTGKALLATAAAILAIECVASSGLAQAVPTIPLAPPTCQQYGFDGSTTLRINVPAPNPPDDIAFTATGPHVDAPATAHGLQSQITGGVDQNGHVQLTLPNPGGGAYQFVGDVGDDATVHGTVNGPGGVNNLPWETTAPLKCDGGAPGQALTATVLQPDDIYDVPDGKGRPYKDANGTNIFVVPGQVQLAEPCRRNWCHIVATQEILGNGAQLSQVNGPTWIYADRNFATVP